MFGFFFLAFSNDVPLIFQSASSRSDLFEVKVAGGLVHGENPLLRLFIHTNTVAKDPNAVISFLMALFSESYRGQRKLIINIDNAAGENKNRFLLAFASMLVEFGWFSEVLIILLPPGHTHHVIDSRFSQLHQTIRGRTIVSLADFVRLLPLAYPSPTHPADLVVVDSVSDFKQFFADELPPLAGHKDPLGFRFVRDSTLSDQPVRFWFRVNSTKAWQGRDGTAVGITALRRVPRGQPAPVQPIAMPAAARAKLNQTEKRVRSYISSDETKQELHRLFTSNNFDVRPSESVQPGLFTRASLPDPNGSAPLPVLLLRGAISAERLRVVPKFVSTPAAVPRLQTLHSIETRTVVVTNKPASLQRQKDVLREAKANASGSSATSSSGTSTVAASSCAVSSAAVASASVSVHASASSSGNDAAQLGLRLVSMDTSADPTDSNTASTATSSLFAPVAVSSPSDAVSVAPARQILRSSRRTRGKADWGNPAMIYG